MNSCVFTPEFDVVYDEQLALALSKIILIPPYGGAPDEGGQLELARGIALHEALRMVHELTPNLERIGVSASGADQFAEGFKDEPVEQPKSRRSRSRISRTVQSAGMSA